jgi:hypothetical protein
MTVPKEKAWQCPGMGSDLRRIAVSQMLTDLSNWRGKIFNHLRKPWLCCLLKLGHVGGGGGMVRALGGRWEDGDKTSNTVVHQHRLGRDFNLAFLGNRGTTLSK